MRYFEGGYGAFSRDTLGQFEVVGYVGSGGMGGVYRADGAKHLRKAGARMLPEDFASDPKAK